jgi:2-iminobutanoate/2-iminopropanoate deaminase
MKRLSLYFKRTKQSALFLSCKAGIILVAICILFAQCNSGDSQSSEKKVAKKKGINPSTIYPPDWAYSHAVEAGGFIFTSGQPAWDKNHKYVSYNIREQAHQVFENLKATLEAAGSSLDDVVHVKGYLKRGEYYKVYDEVWQEYFHQPYPARITVFDDFGDSTLIELSVIACKGSGQNK